MNLQAGMVTGTTMIRTGIIGVMVPCPSQAGHSASLWILGMAITMSISMIPSGTTSMLLSILQEAPLQLPLIPLFGMQKGQVRFLLQADGITMQGVHLR